MIDLRAEMIDGAVHVRGQKYVLANEVAHVKQDGSPTVLLVWGSLCAECGQPFETRSPPKTKWLSRRCKGCAKPGRRA